MNKGETITYTIPKEFEEYANRQMEHTRRMMQGDFSWVDKEEKRRKKEAKKLKKFDYEKELAELEKQRARVKKLEKEVEQLRKGQ